MLQLVIRGTILTAGMASLAACADSGQSTGNSAGVTTLSTLDTQVADDACATLVEGDACSFVSHNGQTLTGTCRPDMHVGAGLLCMPEGGMHGGPGGMGGGMGGGMDGDMGGPGHAPPQEAIDACASLVAGDACTFTGGMGETVTGTCNAGPDGNATLACAPEGMGPDGDGPGFGPPQEAIDACASLVAGDACTFTGGMGETVSGTCDNGPEGDGTLACAPAGGPGGCPGHGHH